MESAERATSRSIATPPEESRGSVADVTRSGPGGLIVLTITSGVVVAALFVIAGGWLTMWKASVRLSPDPVGEAQAVALAAAGGDPELAEYIASGTRLYSSTCIACHGAGGTGIKGNGKPLANSSFVRSLDDENLLKFIRRGRDPSDPANTTGVGMPAKGGNPALSEDDMLDIISYLRSLPGNATQTAQNQ